MATTGTRTAQATRQAVQQRSAAATHSLREALHLPADLNDTAILGTAVAEVAARESRRNAQFAAEVRKVYDELAQLRKPTRARGQTQTQPLPPLVPIRRDLPWRPIDPFAPPDPQYLIQVYGSHQLDRALQEYTLPILKRTADVVQAAHPGTKPRNKSVKQSVIDYIVQYS
jgi:hypothetical protein